MSDIAVLSADSQRHKKLQNLLPHNLDVRSEGMAMITEAMRQSAVLRDVHELTDSRKQASLSLQVRGMDILRRCWDGDTGALRGLSTDELANLAQV